MDPPQQIPPRAPDPVITIAHVCSKCTGALGDLRVHEGTGSTGAASRGKLVQGCRACYASTFHTPAYVFDDATHLLVRIRAHQFGHVIPYASAHAPLRFAPAPLARPPDGPLQCRAEGCSTRGGNRRQASQKCIEHRCKSCCIDAAQAALQSNTYRDSCKAHAVAGNAGAPILPPPPQHAQLAPLQLQYPPAQPQADLIPAPPARQPQPQPPAGHGGNPGGRGRGRGAARGPVGADGSRQLARPMSMTWVNQHLGPQDLVDTGKVARQRLDAIVNHTVDLIIFHTNGANPLQLQLQVPSFPQMQLSAHSVLLQSLEINNSAWIDLYNHPGWKTLQVSTAFGVDKHRPAIIRIRPSLLVELRLEDCPGMDEILSQQSRKRVGTALVSPPKKLARTDNFSAPTQARYIESFNPPSAPPTLSTPSSAVPSLPFTSAMVARPPPVGRNFPHGFFTVEHQEGWGYYDQLHDSGSKTSIAKAWPLLFPSSHYAKTTATKYRGIWLKAPSDIKEYFIARGRTPEGSWDVFAAACTANAMGQPWRPEPSVLEIPLIPEPVVQASAPPPAFKAPPIADEQPSTSAVEPAAPSSSDSNHTINPGEFGVCSFCDSHFTIALSAKAVALLGKLMPSSTLTPIPANPNHYVASLSHQSAAFCQQHRTDSLLLPLARANHWPEHINYAELSDRTETVAMIPLQEILEDLDGSDFFASSSADPSKFNKDTAYFGELGYSVISRTVRTLFPAATITAHYAPLSWDQLIEQVLIPEALICLIVDELQVSPEEAFDIIGGNRERCVARIREETATLSEALTPFPMSSPLLPPHSLSPSLLEPAQWEEEEHGSPPPPDPLTLCNFCDAELPTQPSDSLIACARKLFDISVPCPLPENPLHRRISHQRTADYCAQHRFEQQHIPRAIVEGWPFKPNFATLFHRILNLSRPLLNLCQVLDQSFFFTSAREYYGTKVAQRSSLGAQYSSNRSSQHGAGYYGERGYQLLVQTIRFMFPSSPDFLAKFQPLTYDIVVLEILLPEAAI
ncbi:hypothetical protein C8F04DRAFT_1180685 [Mycena alexandri]|uniref:Restriction of telomere capping protein 4 n=1 Tax=Mycena alexandri TaxID=1745969 RepID=A0AAD6X713_9AGAR|nr:hypothetical protein C8F04DRAFT_1180685 [Mycena alexandri]